MNLNFTGKMVILVEIDDYGPIQFRINDLEVVKQITKILIKDNADLPIDSYNKREQNKMTQLLNFE